MAEIGDERSNMITTAAALEEVITPHFDAHGLGYALVAFSVDGPGFAHFVSNVTRETMCAVLKEMVMRLEQDELIDDGDLPEKANTPAVQAVPDPEPKPKSRNKEAPWG